MRTTLIVLACVLLCLGWAQLALGAEPNFVWRGESGYRVKIYLADPVGNESESFIFTDPQGKRLAQYSQSLTNPYFQLRLSPDHRRLTGQLDIGGEKPGEYFLKGRVGGILELVKILEPGREIALDRGRTWEKGRDGEKNELNEEKIPRSGRCFDAWDLICF
ncbi:MAG: hypothetical protein ACK5CA_09980 [Cyanobacteriota bacterium]